MNPTAPRRRPRSRKRNAVRLVLPILFGTVLAGCALVHPLPRPTTLDERLQAMPTAGHAVRAPVTILWDDHQIPYIIADDDDDAAYALGLVHAHLRLGQMAIYRRIAQGRIAELGGPLATEIDHGIRILDFGRAAAAMREQMPAATQRWMQRFVDGINHYQATVADLPHEYRVLGLRREPWTVDDLLTFGRLAGTDVSWLVWFNLLPLRERSDWPEIWARLTQGDADPAVAAGNTRSAALGRLLGGISRSGSNSLAVSPQRTGGGAILANDPHLGINLPNTWLIAGVKSPSYHAVGLMVPGLPFFAIGRNTHIAWGGTNMRAATSDLVDVSTLPAGAFRDRKETLRVRWWRDEEITVRETAYGPVISDAPQLAGLGLPPLALRWVGHRPSDEITAMLKVAQASTFEEFRRAFATFAVSGQTMLYADDRGNIGKVHAVTVPDRSGPVPADMILTPGQSDVVWGRLRTADSLPATLNPPEGVIASANNRPNTAEVPVGYFFSPDDRVQRMQQLTTGPGFVDRRVVQALQRDVFVQSSVALRDAFIAAIDRLDLGRSLTAQEADVVALMRAWDGHYRDDERGPVAFELVRHAFTGDFYRSIFGDSDWAAFAGIGQIKDLMLEDIERADSQTLAPPLRAALAEAAARLDRFPTWGDMHRLQLGHPLRFVPIVGSRYRVADYPVGGTTDALMKTAHAATNERHATRYGSNARHVSDMADPDANYFVVLGGQDGWLNSATFVDQVALWRRGEYVTMPLTDAAIARRFPRRMVLTPRS